MIKCKPGDIEDRTTNQINNKNSIEKEPVYYNADESPHSIKNLINYHQSTQTYTQPIILPERLLTKAENE